MIDPLTLPKAELHLHIEGTLEPDLMFELARRNGVSLPYADAEAVRRAYSFSNLQSFLDVYYRACSVLIHERDFYELTSRLPGARPQPGRSPRRDLLRPADPHRPRRSVRNRRRWNRPGVGRGAAARDHVTADHVLPARPVGRRRDGDARAGARAPGRDLRRRARLGRGGSSHRRSSAHVFERAIGAGFRAVAHAGEEGPPDYIWQALDVLGAERIDHGVRCLEDRVSFSASRPTGCR